MPASFYKPQVQPSILIFQNGTGSLSYMLNIKQYEIQNFQETAKQMIFFCNINDTNCFTNKYCFSANECSARQVCCPIKFVRHFSVV